MENVGKHMRRRQRAFALLLIPLAALTIGWGSSLKEIQTAGAAVTSIQADFVQEKHMAILAKPLVAHGRFVFKRPDSLRWEYRDPMRRLLLMHNGRSRHFVGTSTGWIQENTAGGQAMEMVLGEIGKWISGRFEETPLFNVAVTGNKVVMTPGEEGTAQFITRVEMVMADTPGIMKEVVVYESADSYTRFLFVDQVLDGPLSDSVFTDAP